MAEFATSEGASTEEFTRMCDEERTRLAKSLSVLVGEPAETVGMIDWGDSMTCYVAVDRRYDPEDVIEALPDWATAVSEISAGSEPTHVDLTIDPEGWETHEDRRRTVKEAVLEATADLGGREPSEMEVFKQPSGAWRAVGRPEGELQRVREALPEGWYVTGGRLNGRDSHVEMKLATA